MIEDLLYGEIKPEGLVRSETEKITDHVTVEYEVTTKNGEDHYLIKSITITSHSNMTVKVDEKTVVQPPQPYYDDGCYFRNKPITDPALPASYFRQPNPADDICFKQSDMERAGIKNDWTPSDFGYVGLPKLRDDIPKGCVRDTCLDALRRTK